MFLLATHSNLFSQHQIRVAQAVQVQAVQVQEVQAVRVIQ